MIYTATISTPKSTDAANKKRSRLSVTKGLVYKVEIDFPHGSAGLLHAQIFQPGFQIWPTNPNEDFHTPGFVISFEDTYLKDTAPYRFDILTWNEDDTYAHTMQIRIGMVSKEAFMARFMPGMLYDDMLHALSEISRQQEADKLAIINNPFGRT